MPFFLRYSLKAWFCFAFSWESLLCFPKSYVVILFSFFSHVLRNNSECVNFHFFIGSAQLIFSVTDVVEKTDCNKTVVLPCYVTNLKENNANVMFVTWKKQGKVIFSFDGARQEFFRDPAVPSANLLSRADLPKGIASLTLNSAEADVGNYSCEVTESNREGETRFELRKHSGELSAIVLEPVGRENKQNLMGKKNHEYDNVLL